MRPTTMLALMIFLGPACTEPNPNYLAPDAGGRDQRVADTAAGDGQPARDLLSPADLELRRCETDSDCADDLACTQDVCGSQGTCQHALASGTCLIDGVCYAAGDRPAEDSCASCDPGSDPFAWTSAPDGTPCADDGLWCTEDRCSGGSCIHPATTGCLINGQCQAAGWSASGSACSECLPEQNAAALTFVAGKACQAAGGKEGICYQNACWPLLQEIFEPKIVGPGSTNLLKTSLNAVAQVSPGGEIWAAGGFSSSTSVGGLLVPLETTSAAMPILTSQMMRALHYRLAVGDSGQAWYHDGKRWAPEISLTMELQGLTRSAVWGARFSGQEVYYLSDYQTPKLPGVVRCSGIPGSFSCEDHHSFPTGTLVGGIMGSVTGSSQGPLWAASYGTSEDIFYNPGSGTSWSRSSPQGCEDLGLSGLTPCSNTSGDLSDLYGSGPQDIWVVGTGGIILRYDGAAWQRITDAIPEQNQTHFTAVFSSPADGLVSIAYHRLAYWGRTVGLLTLNTVLGRWLAPIELYRSETDLAEIHDIGGSGYGQLYLVGQRAVDAAAGIGRPAGWIVHLAEP